MDARTRIGRVLLVSGLAAAAGGCVSQRAYDNLNEELRLVRAQKIEAESRLEEALELNARHLNESAASRAASGSLSETNAELRQQLANARDTISDLEDRLDSLELGRLDAGTDLALRELAARFPRLVTYDSDRGMLRFASDLTFDSGSAVVKETARESLRALAEILRGGAAGAYDVVIVGHTDSQRPSASTQQRHPTNMHLSAHRAISVRSELAQLGVQPGRMQAAGWGEHRPAVPNTASGNTPANRRVEIFLVPSANVAGVSTTPSGMAPDRERLNAPAFEPTK